MKSKMHPSVLASIAAGASLKTEKIRTELADIHIASIRPNPHQPRIGIDPASLRDLAESIRLHGLIQPVTVTRSQNGYVLISGHTRLEAHKLLGRDTIRANIIEADDDDLAILALIENVARTDLHPLEIAMTLSREPFTSMRDDHIASALGYSATKVRNIRATMRLAPDVFDEIRSGFNVPLEYLVELQKLTPELQRTYWELIKTYKIGRSELREAVRSETARESAKRSTPISRSGSGYKIDCSAISDSDKEKLEAELHALLSKYIKG